VPNKNLEVLLDSFVRENKSFHLYELYIDKLDPNNYNLIIYAGDKSLTQVENEMFNQKNLACCKIRNVSFHVYSGVEHYFKQNNIPNNDSVIFNINANNMELWAVRDSSGTLITYKIDGGYPFLPLPMRIKKGVLKPPIVNGQ
jgi:hypothetical protein